VLAAAKDYERLLDVAARGGSLVELLEKRLTSMWNDERLEVIRVQILKCRGVMPPSAQQRHANEWVPA
jgi:hypothetical protein